MGFMSKLFGGKDYPELDGASPASEALKRHMDQLEPFVQKVKDNLEIVSGDQNLYVYIGKPPSAFGLAWFENGRDVNLKSLISERGLSQPQAASLAGKLGEVYTNNSAAQRFSTAIAGKTITVTPSEKLAASIGQVLREAVGTDNR